MSVKTEEKGTKKVRKGDKVYVLAGNYRGQTGVVLRREGPKVIVQGINLRKKHVKKSQQNPKGDILTIERPIHISNVQVCIGEDQPVKLKVQQDKQGKRHLCYQESGKEVIYRSVRAQK